MYRIVHAANQVVRCTGVLAVGVKNRLRQCGRLHVVRNIPYARAGAHYRQCKKEPHLVIVGVMLSHLRQVAHVIAVSFLFGAGTAQDLKALDTVPTHFDFPASKAQAP